MTNNRSTHLPKYGTAVLTHLARLVMPASQTPHHHRTRRPVRPARVLLLACDAMRPPLRRSRFVTIGLAVCLIGVSSLAAVALSQLRSATAPRAHSSNITAADDDTAVVATPDVNLDQTPDASSSEDPISVQRARDQLAVFVRSNAAAQADGVGLAAVTAGLFAAEAARLPSTLDDFTHATLTIAAGLVTEMVPEVGQLARAGDASGGLSRAISLGGAGGGGGGGSIAGGAAGLMTDLSAGSLNTAGAFDTMLEGVLTERALGLRPGALDDASGPISNDRSNGHDRQRGQSNASHGLADTHGRADSTQPGARTGQGAPDVAAVPEPSILLLMGVGLSGLTMLERRRRIGR